MTELLTMNPFDQVRAQLARQKWAVDTRDAGALPNIYAFNCVLILKNEGLEQVARIEGRDNIIEHMVRGWRANTAWKPGSMIHQIGTQLLEPMEGGTVRCWSYATYVHLLSSGTMEIRGYGKYRDIWTLEDTVWRILEREVHIFGLKLSQAQPMQT